MGQRVAESGLTLLVCLSVTRESALLFRPFKNSAVTHWPKSAAPRLQDETARQRQRWRLNKDPNEDIFTPRFVRFNWLFLVWSVADNIKADRRESSVREIKARIEGCLFSLLLASSASNFPSVLWRQFTNVCSIYVVCFCAVVLMRSLNYSQRI